MPSKGVEKPRTLETRPVKVLSVRQPWADLILAGPKFPEWKWAENRGWRTLHRGELFIHASRLEPMPTGDVPDEWRELWRSAPGRRETGAIIGRVELVACLPAGEVEDVFWKLENRSRRTMNPEQIRLMDLLRNVPAESWDHVIGPHCIVLLNPRRLARPIRGVLGKLNIWNFDLSVSAR